MGNYDDLMDGHPDEPLFTVADTDCSTFTSDPPPRVFLTQGAAEIPLGIVGLLSAPGGSSKSMLALSVSLAIASGIGYIGFTPTAQRKVLILSGEDEKSEIHRRASPMLGNIHPDSNGGIDATAAQQTLQHLMIPALTGMTLKLSEKMEDISETLVYRQLIAALKQFEEIGMVVIDTASRFRGGSENAAEDAAFFISLCEQIAKRTGATILIITHSNKVGGGHQQSVRGSSALVDNARFVMTMDPDKEDEALIRFRVAKNNYGPTGAGSTFRRAETGLLELLEDDAAKSQKALAGLGGNEAGVIELVTELHNEGNSLSIREFERVYGGKHKDFGLTQQALGNGLRALVKKGQLRLIKSDSGRTTILAPVIT